MTEHKKGGCGSLSASPQATHYCPPDGEHVHSHATGRGLVWRKPQWEHPPIVQQTPPGLSGEAVRPLFKGAKAVRRVRHCHSECEDQAT